MPKRISSDSSSVFWVPTSHSHKLAAISNKLKPAAAKTTPLRMANQPTSRKNLGFVDAVERSRLTAMTNAGMPITSQFRSVTCCGTYGNGVEAGCVGQDQQ